MDNPKNISIDEYFSSFPKDIQAVLGKLRRVIKESAPETQEIVNYGIATLKLNGNLVHFAAFKKHIGFYSTPSAIEEFEEQLLPYKHLKVLSNSRWINRYPLGLLRRW